MIASWLAPMAFYLGGVPAMTVFFVCMVKAAVCHTNAWRSHIFLSADVLKLMADDPDLRKQMCKEVDKWRKPPIAAFVHAKITGVTFDGMDKLRFATIWTPGHSTLANAIREQERGARTAPSATAPAAHSAVPSV